MTKFCTCNTPGESDLEKEKQAGILRGRKYPAAEDKVTFLYSKVCDAAECGINPHRLQKRKPAYKFTF